mmetsp:Transcript_22799/g.50613  ORF Transcript_22799/g.50613 Transcript_22799/m.50613 type:complete len:226 (+) Transcript_22799:454-1131(+)
MVLAVLHTVLNSKDGPKLPCPRFGVSALQPLTPIRLNTNLISLHSYRYNDIYTERTILLYLSSRFRRHPFDGLFEYPHQTILLAIWFDFMVVFPGNEWRCRYHYSFDTWIRSRQPEFHSPIVQEIKFEIPSATQELPFTLLLGVFQILPFFNDGEPRGHPVRCDVLDKVHGCRCGRKVVKKHPTDASVFAAGRQIEIIVAGLFHSGIIDHRCFRIFVVVVLVFLA